MLQAYTCNQLCDSSQQNYLEAKNLQSIQQFPYKQSMMDRQNTQRSDNSCWL